MSSSWLFYSLNSNSFLFEFVAIFLFGNNKFCEFFWFYGLGACQIYLLFDNPFQEKPEGINGSAD